MSKRLSAQARGWLRNPRTIRNPNQLELDFNKPLPPNSTQIEKIRALYIIAFAQVSREQADNRAITCEGDNPINEGFYRQSAAGRIAALDRLFNHLTALHSAGIDLTHTGLRQGMVLLRTERYPVPGESPPKNVDKSAPSR